MDSTPITMLTLTNTDSEEASSDVDKNTPEFQTPPENHNRSSLEILSQVAGEMEETAVRADDAVCLGEWEEETLGSEEVNGCDDDRCLENVKEVEEIAGFETDLNSPRVIEDEIGESVPKKARVSEKLGFAEETGVTEKVDWAEIELEGLALNQISSPGVGNSPVKKAESNDSSKEKVIEEDTGEQFPENNVDLAPKISVGEVKEEVLEDDTVEPFEIPLGALGCEAERVQGTENLKDCSFDDGVVDNEKVGELCLVDNAGLSEKASLKMAREDVPDATRKDSGGASRRETPVEIESFRYEGGGSDRARKRASKARKKASKGKRQLPPSIRGEEKDAEVVGMPKNVEAKEGSLPLSSHGKEKDVEVEVQDNPNNVEPKELSFLELLDAVEKFLGLDKRPELKEVDFLEIAKERGMTFPIPRWR